MMPRIGQMKERITIEGPTEVRNTFGEVRIEWQTVGTVWAKVDGMSSRETLQAMQANAIVSHKVLIRFFDGITHEHRIVWRNKKMEIATVIEKMDRRFHELLVREIQ